MQKNFEFDETAITEEDENDIVKVEDTKNRRFNSQLATNRASDTIHS